jgi:hypothetical protein
MKVSVFDSDSFNDSDIERIIFGMHPAAQCFRKVKAWTIWNMYGEEKVGTSVFVIRLSVMNFCMNLE